MINKNTLAGWNVVIMRPVHQAQALADIISEQQGNPIILPTIDIITLPISAKQQAQWIANIEAASFIFIVSINAIECAPPAIVDALRARGQQLQTLTMGKSTTQAVEKQKLPVFFTPPPGSTSESILAMDFLQKEKVQGKTVLLLAGGEGRTVFADTLRERGAQIMWMKVYRQQKPELDLVPLLKIWQQQGKFCFIATSVNCLENLLTSTPVLDLSWLYQQSLVVISPRIAHYAKKNGFQHIFIAHGADSQAIMVALQAMNKVPNS